MLPASSTNCQLAGSPAAMITERRMHHYRISTGGSAPILLHCKIFLDCNRHFKDHFANSSIARNISHDRDHHTG